MEPAPEQQPPQPANGAAAAGSVPGAGAVGSSVSSPGAPSAVLREPQLRNGPPLTHSPSLQAHPGHTRTGLPLGHIRPSHMQLQPPSSAVGPPLSRSGSVPLSVPRGAPPAALEAQNGGGTVPLATSGSGGSGLALPQQYLGDRPIVGSLPPSQTPIAQASGPPGGNTLTPSLFGATAGTNPLTAQHPQLQHRQGQIPGMPPAEPRIAGPAETGGQQPEARTPEEGRDPGEHYVMEAKTIKEILHTIDPSVEISPEAEEGLLDIADDFIHSVTAFSCQLARHRKSQVLEPADIMLHLERHWNMRIPGYPSEEYRVYKRPAVSELHKQRLASVRKTAMMSSPAGDAAGGAAAGAASAPLQQAAARGGGLLSPKP